MALGRAFALGLFMAGAGTTVSAALELSSGAFSFSDELGGFRLLAVTGSGSPDDPIVITEEIAEAQPVTLIVRRRPAARGAGADRLSLHLVKVVVNRSVRVWAAFELELQEILGEPSIYTDGLSFNQFGKTLDDVGSDSFGSNRRLFEPYDRVRFESGHVDPDGGARFQVTITDPTPTREFYLVQDPQLLSAAVLQPPRHARLVPAPVAGTQAEAGRFPPAWRIRAPM